jgi:ADP-ribosyl-[dinitrogen reductase] hydrolase
MADVNPHRALGCIVGSAVGDALGAPFEFGSAGRYTARHPVPVLGGNGEMTESPLWNLGEATDDTQMGVIESEILLRSGLDLPTIYDVFVAWADDPDTKDVGTTTSAVLRHPTGYPDASCSVFAATGRGAANGCIMRAAPAAVWFVSNPDIDADAASMDLAAVTHGDPVAGWARVLLNRLLAEGIRGGNPLDAIDEALAVLPEDVG